MNSNTSQFKSVVSHTLWNDKLYRFLQVVFHLYPEDKFHHLIGKVSADRSNDGDIYKEVQAGLKGIKPFLSELTYALPALKKQKKEMAHQVLQLLSGKRDINGYLEIGSTGRYISKLRKHIKLSGPVFISNDIAPSNSVADIFERGQLGKLGSFFPLDNYKPIPANIIADESLDLVTCHIGLHHCPPELLDGYIGSIRRVLRKGGRFIMREHDVHTPEMATFVSLVHTVFNLGLNVTYEVDAAEFKAFQTIDAWSRIITAQGFEDTTERLLQDNDPSDNTLLCFVKQ
jgi:SAM-dependent methyltransferase